MQIGSVFANRQVFNKSMPEKEITNMPIAVFLKKTRVFMLRFNKSPVYLNDKRSSGLLTMEKMQC